MSQGYTQWSQDIEYRTQEERDWLIEKLQPGPGAGWGEDGCPVCDTILDQPEEHAVWVAAEESGDIDALLQVVLEFQKKFGISTLWYFSYASTFSKPAIGGFGGGAAVVYKGEIHEMSTNMWIEDKAKELGPSLSRDIVR